MCAVMSDSSLAPVKGSPGLLKRGPMTATDKGYVKGRFL